MYFISICMGILQFFIMSYVLFTEVNKTSPAAFLWGTLMIMFGLPHLVTSIFEDMPYPDYIISEASLFVVLFCVFYILVRSQKHCEFIGLQDRDKLVLYPDEMIGSYFELVCFFCFLFSIINVIVFGIESQGGLLNTSWAGGREAEIGYISFLGVEERVVFAFSGLSLYFYLLKKKIKVGVVLLLFLFLVIVTRNRVEILPVLIFFTTIFLIKIKKIKLKHIIMAALIAASVIYIVYGIRALRYLGTLENIIDGFSWSYLNDMIKTFIVSQNGELGLRQFFYFFISEDNKFEGFNQGYTYIRMLLVFLPSRWSFGIKPESFDLYMGNAVGMAAGGSMHPTLFGDCFGNLYWFGVLLGGFWAFFANRVDSLITSQKNKFFKIMIFFLAAYTFVVSGRGSVYNGFEKLAWGVVILFLFKIVWENFCKKTSET